MLNKNAKGNRAELAARKLLTKEGFLVEKKNTSRWASNDFWGTFDLICIQPHTGLVKLVQVKTNVSDFYKARQEVRKWAYDNQVIALNIDCEVWLKEPRKDWRKDILALDMSEMIIDA